MAEAFPLFPKIAVTSVGARGGTWVALEKIHGAQLVINVTASGVRFGKRKQWLDEVEPFFGWQLIRHELAEAAVALHRAAAPEDSVTLYGELFGGRYPHPDVATVPGMAPVQTGIWYAPDLRYAVFDVLVTAPSGAGGQFAAHSDVVRLAAGAGLLTPPLLQRGPRQALEPLPVRFASRVPGLLGLPPLADNWAEGWVLKADASAAPDQRAILKRKIPEFDEAAFDESAPWNPDQVLSPAALAAWGERLINAPRVASARSKLGDGAHARALADEILLDTLVDLQMAFPGAFSRLSEDAQTGLETRLRTCVVAFLAA